MTEQDKLRNKLRDYYDHQQIPFDNKEWEQASVYLATERRRKKVLYSSIVVSTFLISLFGILFFVQQLPEIPQAVIEQGDKPKFIHDRQVFNAEKSGSSPMKSDVNLQEHTEGPSVGVSMKRIQHNTSGGSVAASQSNAFDSIQFKKYILAQPIDKQNKHQSVLKNADNVAEKTGSKTELAINLRQIDLSQEQRTSNENQKNEIKEVAAGGSLITQALETKNEIKRSDSDVATYKQSEEKNSKEQKLESSTTRSENTNQLLPQNTKDLPDFNSAELQSKKVEGYNDKDSQANSVLKDITNIDQEKNAVKSFIDTIMHTSNNSFQTIEESVPVDSLKEIFTRKNLAESGMFYELGTAWLYGWKGEAVRDARGFSPIVGIHYWSPIARRFSFSIGVQYLQVSNMRNSSKTSRVSSFVYGEQSTVTVITPSSAYYLLAPLRLHYFINKKNSLALGINFAYLLNIDAKVTTHEERPGFDGNYKSTKLGGYTEGFSWYDSQIAFSYRRRLNKFISLQAEFFFGLIDVKQDDFFDYKNKERNSGGKLSFIFQPLRKNRN